MIKLKLKFKLFTTFLVVAIATILSSAYAADVGILVCQNSVPTGVVVAKVNLNLVNTEVDTYDPPTKSTVGGLFTNIMANNASGLVVNANFFVNYKNSKFPQQTPIGPIYNKGESVLFPDNSGAMGRPYNVNQKSLARADTLAIYLDSNNKRHAAIVSSKKWKTWISEKNVREAVSGLIIMSGGTYTDKKTKIAGINYDKSRQRTAVGFSSDHDNVLYIVAVNSGNGKGITLSDLANKTFNSVPDYCGDSDLLKIDSILNLDGGGSTALAVQDSNGVKMNLLQNRALASMLVFSQPKPQ